METYWLDELFEPQKYNGAKELENYMEIINCEIFELIFYVNYSIANEN